MSRKAALAPVVALVFASASASADPPRGSVRLCAGSIYMALRRDALRRMPPDYWANTLRKVASLEACEALPAGLRRTALRASRAPRGERGPILAEYPPVDPPPACQPPAAPHDRLVWGTNCIPRDPRVVLLLRENSQLVGSPERAFIAGVVDRLTEASPRLVPAAQLLWVYSNLGFWLHVTVSCPMHVDLETGRVRLDKLYWNPRAGR